MYFRSIALGNALNIFLLIIICTGFHFDYKSAVCVYLYGISGYLFKSLLFFIPYIFLKKENIQRYLLGSFVVSWIPLALFVVWYFVIIFFRIEVLYPDLEFGYISRFPHFLVQIFSAILISLVTTILIFRRRKISVSAL